MQLCVPARARSVNKIVEELAMFRSSLPLQVVRRTLSYLQAFWKGVAGISVFGQSSSQASSLKKKLVGWGSRPQLIAPPVSRSSPRVEMSKISPSNTGGPGIRSPGFHYGSNHEAVATLGKILFPFKLQLPLWKMDTRL